MRVLVAMTALPVPPCTGAALVAWHSLRRWCETNEATLLVAYPSPGLAEHAPPSLQIKQVPGHGWLRRKWNAVAGALVGEPPRMAAVRSRAMETAIRDAWRTGHFDAIAVFEPSQILSVPLELRKWTVANIEDPPSLRARRLARLSHLTGKQRAAVRVAAPFLLRFERRHLPGLARVLVLSRADADDMATASGLRNLDFVPYGVEAAAGQRLKTREARTPASIVISGNMFHWPNVDGVLEFLDGAFPIILRERTDAKLWLVGAEPDPRIVRAAARFGTSVTVMGRVPDIGEVVGRAWVSVCPVRLRIGVQTKVIEAMAAGTPVVSTSAGNSGVNGVPGVHLHVADESAEVASHVLELLRGENWDALSMAGSEWARENFTWARSAEIWSEHLQAVSGARQPRS